MKRKKTKKYAHGGLANIAKSATSLMGDVNKAANVINYGQGAGPSSNEAVGLGAITGATTANKQSIPGGVTSLFEDLFSRQGTNGAASQSNLGSAISGLGGTTFGATFKKGGKVKASSASKRADGCAIRGKTKGKMV